MSKTKVLDKVNFARGVYSKDTGEADGRLKIALTSDDTQVSATHVIIDVSGSDSGAVVSLTAATAGNTYSTAAVTSTTASRATTISTGTSTPATAITGGATGALTARSGASIANHAGATGGATGAASFGSGNASSTLGVSGASGAVTVSSGTSEDAATGDLALTTGASTGTASSSGAASLTTGTVTGTSGSGIMLVRTGASTYAGTGTGGASGALTIGTGATDVTNASGTGGASGAISIATGAASSTAGTASGASGAITIATGNSADAASGDITIQTGTAGGVRGNVNISATTVAVTGVLSTNDLAERGVGAGISLASGSEIIGVPKVVSVAVAYNQADGALFTVPAGETWLITDMWFQTAVSWNGDGAFIVGVTADADGFLTLANSSLATTYDESGGITGWPTGSRGLDSANRGVLLTTAVTLNPRRFRAVAGTTVLIDNTQGTSSAGSGTLYMQYIRLP